MCNVKHKNYLLVCSGCEEPTANNIGSFIYNKFWDMKIYEFLKRNQTWLYLHEKQADEEQKNIGSKLSTKGTCIPNYHRF